MRITHWLTTLGFLGLLFSGIAILLAHPRFYWGETGALGAPSLFDFRAPFLPGGRSGWGRHVHFELAWLCVLNGSIYVVWGLANRHFRKHLVPQALSWKAIRRSVASHLRFRRPTSDEELRYNILQRITYLAVIFLLAPLMTWTGLAMSPGVTSVFPGLVTALGGHQSARTLHFLGTIALVLFVMVHVAMVWRAGFRSRVSAMITGRATTRKKEDLWRVQSRAANSSRRG